MYVSQAIQTPHGISVFGSALLRISPDVAVLNFAATRQQKKPEAAFKETGAAAASIRDFLEKSNVRDVHASRISLAQHWEHTGRGRKPDGYVAKVSFNVLLEDLEKLEAVLTGAIEAGANEINDVVFQSRQLKQHRQRARQQAVIAAREKAAIYAAAVNKGVGDVLHIEDVNPDQLRGNEGHTQREPGIDGDGPIQAFDPGSITVGAAVLILFSLTDVADD